MACWTWLPTRPTWAAGWSTPGCPTRTWPPHSPRFPCSSRCDKHGRHALQLCMAPGDVVAGDWSAEMTQGGPDDSPWPNESAVGEELAAALDLELLPLEGGLYRRTFTGSGATAILFMLIGDDFSAMHRLETDEIYFHHSGSPLKMLLIDPAGAASEVIIGPDALAGQH